MKKLPGTCFAFYIVYHEYSSHQVHVNNDRAKEFIDSLHLSVIAFQ